MTSDEASLIKLNKEELVRITIDDQGRSRGILDDMKSDISDLKK